MTSLKLSYRRGAPAALLLGLIVGAPDIAQAFTQLRGGTANFTLQPTNIPTRGASLVPFGTPQPVAKDPPAAFPPSSSTYAPQTTNASTQTSQTSLVRGSTLSPNAKAAARKAAAKSEEGSSSGIPLTHGGETEEENED